ncbi:hypothetical protein MiSe_68750 [Microseira wollei NIES-4236]|uniref:Uncharacterized protein n=1 Tax=Microseira wollei NIES-4236 TaxID=2530354 RepID=A0AAV3XKL2_9CYAN|nr:hypothetical protein MiSe_68750 [Microseira wollei NIES-4236]
MPTFIGRPLSGLDSRGVVLIQFPCMPGMPCYSSKVSLAKVIGRYYPKSTVLPRVKLFNF